MEVAVTVLVGWLALMIGSTVYGALKAISNETITDDRNPAYGVAVFVFSVLLVLAVCWGIGYLVLLLN